MAEKNDVAKEVSSIMAGGRFNRVSCHFQQLSQLSLAVTQNCAIHSVVGLFIFSRCTSKCSAMGLGLSHNL